MHTFRRLLHSKNGFNSNYFRHYSNSFTSRTIISPAASQKIVVEAPETRITTLPSGFRVASENTRMPTATVSLLKAEVGNGWVIPGLIGLDYSDLWINSNDPTSTIFYD